jgi:hypothetical protein
MSSTPNPENEAPKPSDETEAVRRLVVPESVEAAADSDSDRSPGKTDRDIAAALSSDSAESTEVIRELITPEAIAASTDSEGDRSPGKTDRDVIIPESTTNTSESPETAT